MSIPGSQLREYRRGQTLTQRAFAAMLGVTPNTVARWERGEVPIPAWVSALLHAHREAQDASQHVRTLEAQVQMGKHEVWLLGVKNFALEQKLREQRRRRPSHAGMPAGVLPPKAHEVYKRIARKYHPDRRSGDADVMKDINELWQAMTLSGCPW